MVAPLLGQWEASVEEEEGAKITVHQEGAVGIQGEGVEPTETKPEGEEVRIVEGRVVLVSMVEIMLTTGL